MLNMTENELGKNIGNIIKNRRKTKNMSQSSLGESIGVTHTTISRYERGQIDIPVSALPKISRTCGFKPSEYMKAFCTDDEVRKAIRRMAADASDYYAERLPGSVSAAEDKIIEVMPEGIKPVVVSVSEYLLSRDADAAKNAEALDLIAEILSADGKHEEFVSRMKAYAERLAKYKQKTP